MGMKRDTARREKLARKDDDVMKEKVTTASKLIYGEYRPVNNAKVDRILKTQSLVPTHVRCSINHYL